MPTINASLKGSPSFLYRMNIDGILMLLLLCLAGSGLIILYSASGQDWGYVSRQAVRMAIGFTAVIVLAQFDPLTYRRWGIWLYPAGIILLVLVLVLGINAMGAQRWLNVPGIPRFQPSEIMKLGLPIAVAWFLSRRPLPPKTFHIVGALILVAIPAALIFKQPDLGTAIMVAMSGIIVIFLAGINWWWIVSMLGAAGGAIPIMWFFVMHGYQKQRVLTFLNPELDPHGTGWNIIQSTTAIGSGGLNGKGYLGGTQAQLDFLPESQTDFILAVISEELGLVGAASFLLLYLLITLRGLVITLRARETFGRLLAGSITLTFFFYVFVNMGMVSGILPVVGVPLPLVSYGGTSLITLLAGFGLLMSVSTHRKRT
jgi:rod shape determining protein RodA